MSQVQTEITVAEFLKILAGRLATFDQSDLSSKVAGLTATMEQLETLRLLSIGAPKIHRSQVLPRIMCGSMVTSFRSRLLLN